MGGETLRDERWVECRKSPIALEPVSAFKVEFGKRWQWSVQRVDRDCSAWIACIKVGNAGSII